MFSKCGFSCRVRGRDILILGELADPVNTTVTTVNGSTTTTVI